MKTTDLHDFLELDALPLERERRGGGDGRVLFVSLNPDLTTDFGHFLNYERRLKECCEAAGAAYACFAHQRVQVDFPDVKSVFPSDSGYYSLTRSGALAARGAIVDEFWRAVDGALADLRSRARHDRVVLFLYCGSSMLATSLAERPWAADVDVVVNAFWDFLLPARTGYDHVARLAFQQRVRLLAMSELHGDEIFRDTGLRFEAIANPPPLMGDLEAREELRRHGGVASRPSAADLTLLVPGLMTSGKGKEPTLELYRHACASGRPGLRFVFRDRDRALGTERPATVEVLAGDLTDAQVKAAYRRADATLIPYGAPTFRVRTSGALVDCLCFGAVPLVVRGTWLADACERHDFGVVMDDAEPATVLRALEALRGRLPQERARLFRGAVHYLARHSWSRLFEIIARPAPAPSFVTAGATTARPPSVSLLAEANRLVRAGDYRTAARLFEWLARDSDLDLYRRNIELCARRSGIAAAELLAERP